MSEDAEPGRRFTGLVARMGVVPVLGLAVLLLGAPEAWAQRGPAGRGAVRPRHRR